MYVYYYVYKSCSKSDLDYMTSDLLSRLFSFIIVNKSEI